MATGSVKKIGDEWVVVLGDEARAQLGVAEGDTVFVHSVAEAASAPPAEDEGSRQMRFAREFLEEYRETFEALAR